MAKSKSKNPLRTYVDSAEAPWFSLDDIGDGLYHLRFTPKGMEILNATGEYANPLNHPDALEFIGLCDLLHSGLCMAVNFMGRDYDPYDGYEPVYDEDDDLIPF